MCFHVFQFRIYASVYFTLKEDNVVASLCNCLWAGLSNAAQAVKRTLEWTAVTDFHPFSGFINYS